MKWKVSKIGDVRIIQKFLLFPRRINNEMLWLETISIKQQYISCIGFSHWGDMECRLGGVADAWKLELLLDKGGG